MSWPTCANCGRRAPAAMVEHVEELSAAEIAQAVELRRRILDGGKLAELSAGARRLARHRTRADSSAYVLRRERLNSPRLYWGYAGGLFCTLRCALEFATITYRAGYRRKGS